MQLSVDDWAYVRERASPFVGREWVLEALERFVTGPAGALVLHGPPGCGKTAVSARLAAAAGGEVVLDPAHPGLAAGTLAATVFCRPGDADLLPVAQRLSDQLADAVSGFGDKRTTTLAPEIQIGDVSITTGPVAAGASVTGVRIRLDALGGERAFARGVVQPLQQLLEQGGARRIVVLVDALDEATSVAGETPLPALLSRLAGVHLIVTTRDDPRVLRYLEDADLDIDLVGGAPVEDDDVAAFVRSKLAGDSIAERIAVEAHGNFLYARYVVDALTRADGLKPGDPLPTGGLTGVYRNLIRQRAPAADDLDRFRCVLSALVVARGAGLTVEHIASAARQLADRPISLGDARVAVQTVAQFLTGRAPDGPFRPYHRSFAEFLTSDAADAEWRVDATDAHRAVARALAASVPIDKHGRKDWRSADDYARHYLVGHAAEGQILGELMDDPAFVAAAEPSQLLPALRGNAALTALPSVRTYRRAGAQLHAVTDPSERAAHLALTARQLDADDFADQLTHAHPSAPWTPLWSHWRAEQTHTVVASSQDPARALAVTTVDDAAVAVWGDDRGLLRCSSLTDGEPTWAPAEHGRAIMAVAVGDLEGRPIALSGGYGGVRAWDLVSGTHLQPLAGPRAHQRVTAVALGVVDDRLVALAGFGDGELHLWDVGSGDSRGGVTGHKDEVTGLAVAHDGDRAICVSADRTGIISARDLASGALVGWRTPGEDDHGLTALAAFDRDGAPAIVCAGYDETISVRDAVSTALDGPQLRGHQDMIRSLAVSDVGARRVCVSAADDETVRIWDLVAGRAIGTPLRGHEGSVRSVAITRIEGQPVVVSCGDDGTLRSWELDLDAEAAERRPPTLEGPITMIGRAGAGREDDLDELAYVRFMSAQDWFEAQDFELNAVTVTTVDERSVAVTCGETSGVHVWDLDTGERVGEPYLGDPSANMCVSLAVAEVGPHSLVIAGGRDDNIHAWYLPDGEQVGVLEAEQEGVLAVAVHETDDSVLLASGGGDGTVRFWNLVTGEGHEPLAAHEDDVDWLGIALSDDFAVTVSASFVDGTLRVWPSVPADGEGEAIAAGATAVALAVIGGQPMLVHADTAGAISARELTTSSEPAHLADLAGVNALALGMWRAQPFLVAGDDRGLRVWPLHGAGPLADEHRATIDLGSPVKSVRLGPRGTVVAATEAGVACVRLNPKRWLG